MIVRVANQRCGKAMTMLAIRISSNKVLVAVMKVTKYLAKKVYFLFISWHGNIELVHKLFLGRHLVPKFANERILSFISLEAVLPSTQGSFVPVRHGNYQDAKLLGHLGFARFRAAVRCDLGVLRGNIASSVTKNQNSLVLPIK
ncbi:hypothetical protein BRADI_1g09609v3 [Brachypodium distachyon]|uniref:Uncharacterized protein n=1 Tax=Brachypodium distachyon TaxID=15368 RepID=A0A0Q3GSI1_BRADI|nr:hypothetical protein BRADI_1g09609v3 [Brachypodium distachyon]